jgi:uncharacterized protein DUF6011
MTITAKFASTCPRCRTPIEAGDKVDWERGQKATHVNCPPHGSGCACASCDRREPTPQAPHLDVEDQGVYVLADERIVKIQANRDKTRVYPKLWREISGQRLTEADTRVRGEYEYLDDWQERKALLDAVQATGHRMSLDEARAFILRYGICARCGRGLKDASSVERGLGPICVQYFQGATGAEVLASNGQPSPEGVPSRRPHSWAPKSAPYGEYVCSECWITMDSPEDEATHGVCPGAAGRPQAEPERPSDASVLDTLDSIREYRQDVAAVIDSKGPQAITSLPAELMLRILDTLLKEVSR